MLVIGAHLTSELKKPEKDSGKTHRFLQFPNHFKLAEWPLCVKHHTNTILNGKTGIYLRLNDSAIQLKWALN